MRKKLKRKFSNQYKNIFADRFRPNEPIRLMVFRMGENDYRAFIRPRRKNDLIRKSKMDCYSVVHSFDRAVLQRTVAFWVPVQLYSLNRKSDIQGHSFGKKSITQFGYTYTKNVRMAHDDMFKTSNQLLCEVK